MKSAAEVIAMEFERPHWPDALAKADKLAVALRAAGWIIVRHDAIRLAQLHARDGEGK